MKEISAVVICNNEEHNIKRCLDSLVPVVEEVLVVDSFSTDSTVELAKELGARVLQHEFISYGDQKNWAIEQAKYDIILSLDADESLSEQLIKEINELKKDWNADAFQIRRKINYCGKWIKYGAWNPDLKIRLWDRKKGKWTTPLVHETIKLTGQANVKRLHGEILHFTCHSIEAHIGQINRFSSLMAMQMMDKKIKPRLYHYALKSFWKFVWGYFLKLGFLDGHYGYIIARNSAFGHYLRYTKLKQLRKERNI